MMRAAGSGPTGTGPVPAPLSAQASDRTHTEAPGSRGPAAGDPLARALRALDSISSIDFDGGDGLRTATSVPNTPGTADGSKASSSQSSGRREAILDAASALFAERGYHGASLREISRRVGISHPGMLHHFSSKEVLLSAVIDRLEAHAQGLLNSVDSLAGSPQVLLAALAGPWDPRGHQMALMATLSAEIVNPDHPGRFRIARLRLVHEHVLEKALEGLAEAGYLREGAGPTFLARTVFSELLSLTVREHTVRELQKSAVADPIDDVRELIGLLLVDAKDEAQN